MADALSQLRLAFLADAGAAFRDFYRLQAELAERGDAALSTALTRGLLELLPDLAFPDDDARARFVYNLGVFLGSPGPAADLSRALALFDEALLVFAQGDEEARTLHSRANALTALGSGAEELREAVSCYRRALLWRTDERAIARGVTLHNLGAAFRKLAELEPERAAGHLAESEAALREAIAIREAHGLREGLALSWFHLGLTLNAAGSPDAPGALREAAERFEAAGKPGEAGLARGLLHGGREDRAP